MLKTVIRATTCVLIAVATLGTASAQSADPPEQGYQAPANTTWRAEGEKYFDHLEKTAKDVCDTSQIESPIRLPTGFQASLPDLQFDYRPYSNAPTSQEGVALNLGHTLQWYLDPDDYKPVAGKGAIFRLSSGLATTNAIREARGITFDGSYYRLLQMHLHHPSEHVVDGKRYHMEAHFVHQAPDSGHRVVVAVLLEVDENVDYTSSTRGIGYWFLESGATLLPTYYANTVDRVKTGVYSGMSRTLDLSAMLPPVGPDGKHGYVRYDGALTTPPCSENVSWVIMKTPVKITQYALDSFKATFGITARPLQPLNARIVVIPR